VPHHDVPRWEDIDVNAIDYEARDGQPTGHERTLHSLRSQIDFTEAILNGISVNSALPPAGTLPESQSRHTCSIVTRSRSTALAEPEVPNRGSRVVDDGSARYTPTIATASVIMKRPTDWSGLAEIRHGFTESHVRAFVRR